MEQTITAPVGVATTYVNVRTGQLTELGQAMVVITHEESKDAAGARSSAAALFASAGRGPAAF